MCALSLSDTYVARAGDALVVLDTPFFCDGTVCGGAGSAGWPGGGTRSFMEEMAALLVYAKSRWKAGGRAARESEVVVMCLVPSGGQGNGRSRTQLLKTNPPEFASVARWRGLWDPSTLFYTSLKLPIKH